jgi:putative GTP pyrophosphokinase
MTSPLLTDFDARESVFQGFCEYLQSLLPELLKADGIRFHKIESRVKSRQSLEEKLTRPEKNYATLNDVTDVCGLRIITHFDSEVADIATVLEREFDIDKINSTDKRIYTDPNRFGYVSLHYVISLAGPRLKLTECKAWADCKAEVQIRTILQHAWAEIEHDLGFKSPVAVPLEVKRRFARLAAILETADNEFAGVKNDLTQYATKISAQLKTAQPNVAIDGPSVSELIKSDPLVVECDNEISQRSNKPLFPSDPQKSASIANYLHTVGITTVTALRDFLQPNRDAIIRVAVDRVSLVRHPRVPAGISLLYTCYAVLARQGDINAFVNFLEIHGFGGEEHGDFAAAIIAAFNAPPR